MNHNFFNLSKRKKQDILFELLIGASREGIISKKELNALNRLIASMTFRKGPVKTNCREAGTKKVYPAPMKDQGKKKKTTFYISQKVSDSLDKASMTIRTQISVDLQPQINRSYIVNQALAIILQEFEAEGKESRLMGAITQNT